MGNITKETLVGFWAWLHDSTWSNAAGPTLTASMSGHSHGARHQSQCCMPFTFALLTPNLSEVGTNLMTHSDEAAETKYTTQGHTGKSSGVGIWTQIVDLEDEPLATLFAGCPGHSGWLPTTPHQAVLPAGSWWGGAEVGHEGQGQGSVGRGCWHQVTTTYLEGCGDI